MSTAVNCASMSAGLSLTKARVNKKRARLAALAEHIRAETGRTAQSFEAFQHTDNQARSFWTKPLGSGIIGVAVCGGLGALGALVLLPASLLVTSIAMGSVIGAILGLSLGSQCMVDEQLHSYEQYLHGIAEEARSPGARGRAATSNLDVPNSIPSRQPVRER
jgi:hypothetical protein